MHSLLSTAAAIAVAQPALAQAENPVPQNESISPKSADAPNEPGSDVDAGEIIVTAQRRAQRLQDVPVSVTAVGGTQLARSNITGLEALAIRSPAVRIAVAPVSDFIAIRGIGSSLNLGFEQSVATFVDGIYRSRSRSTRSALFDVQQVEVLKGPQTTFFGNNAIAGAFNITTRKPGDMFAANISVLYAPSTSEYNVEGGADIPLTPTLSARLAGRASGMNGYIKNDYLDKHSPRLRDEIGRLSLHWQPSSNFETQVRFDLSRQRDQRTFDIQLLNCPPPVAFGTPKGTCARYLNASGGSVDQKLDNHSQANPSFYNLDYYELEQTSTLGLGSANLVFTTGYYHHKYDLLTDVNPVPAQLGGSVVGTIQSTPARFQERYHQFSQEIRLQSANPSPLSYMAGLYYADDDLNITSFQGDYMAPFGSQEAPYYNASSPIAFRILNEQQSRTLSAFGSLTYKVAAGLRVNAGLRYTSVRKTAHRDPSVGVAGSIPSDNNFQPAPADIQTSFLPKLGVDLGDFAQNKRTDSKLMPTASLQYDVAPDVMSYFSYSKGFKAGGFSGYTSSSIFGPENVNAFEMGVKSRLFDGRLTLNAAAFLENFKGLQQTATVLFPNGSQKAIVGNAASARSKGIELGAIAKIFKGFQLSTDLTLLDARFRNYRNAPCTTLQAVGTTTCVQDLSGKRTAFAPKFSGNVTASFTGDLSEDLAFRIDATAYFTSSFYQQPIDDPFLSQPGNAKVDIAASLMKSNEAWEVSVVGKNLTDKITASYRQVIPTAVGSVAALQEPGRSIAFRLSLKY
jgi:outer membrane receptor protein involved in Fe transport